MDDTKYRFGYDSLAYFGKVNASISHELKNIMAIISETAGLLSDLSDMASSGKPVESDMLASCTDSITEEIQRGFATIRQMNRFSHSVDTPVGSVNLTDVLDIVINLSGYLSFSGKTSLSPCNGFEPIASTCPFILQAILYETLVYTFKNKKPEMETGISIQPQGDSAWRIIFSGFSANELEPFPNIATETMAASIDITIHCDSAAGQIELVVPLIIENLAAQPVSQATPDGGESSQKHAKLGR